MKPKLFFLVILTVAFAPYLVYFYLSSAQLTLYVGHIQNNLFLVIISPIQVNFLHVPFIHSNLITTTNSPIGFGSAF